MATKDPAVRLALKLAKRLPIRRRLRFLAELAERIALGVEDRGQPAAAAKLSAQADRIRTLSRRRPAA